MSRYKAVGDWDERARHRVRIYSDFLEEDDQPIATIIVEQADCQDTKGGRIYSGGTYRVTLKNVPGMRSKTFYGEMAWMDARRLASDAASKCGDWRWGLDL